MADLEIELNSTGKEAVSTIQTLNVDLSTLEKTLKNVEDVLTNMYLDLGHIEKNGLKVNENTKKTGKEFKKTNNHVKSTNNSLKKLNNLILKAKNNTSGLSGTLSKLANVVGGITATKALGSGFGSFVTEAMDASETLNLFNRVFDNLTENGETTFSELGKKATQFQNELHEAFNTNKVETMNMQAIYQSLGENIGINDDKAEIMSEAMTKMTYDLASLYNKDEKEVAKAIQSGVYAGQTRPMRQFGVDLTMQNLSATLGELGINRSISDLSQAEKEILRYITTLRQADIAMGDFADTMDSPANQIKMLKQQFAELRIAIGNLFVNALARILPFVNAIIMVAKNMLETLASLFGIELKDFGSGVSSIYDVSDGIDGIGSSADDASKKVKELKRQTLGFDQINNITSPTPSKGSGSGSGAGGLGAIDKRLLDAIKDYDNGMSKVDNKAGEIRDKIMEWLGFTKQVDEETGKVSWKFDTMGRSVNQIAVDLGKKIADKLNELTDDVKWNDIGQKLGEGITTSLLFMNTFVEEYNWIALGEDIAKFLNGAIEKTDFKEVGKTITNKIKVAIEMLYGFITELDYAQLGRSIADFINSAIDNIPFDLIIKGIKKLASGIGTALREMFGNLDWDSKMTLVGLLVGTAILKAVKLAFGGSLLKMALGSTAGVASGAIGTAIGSALTGLTVAVSGLTIVGVGIALIADAIKLKANTAEILTKGIESRSNIFDEIRKGIDDGTKSSEEFNTIWSTINVNLDHSEKDIWNNLVNNKKWTENVRELAGEVGNTADMVKDMVSENKLNTNEIKDQRDRLKETKKNLEENLQKVSYSREEREKINQALEKTKEAIKECNNALDTGYTVLTNIHGEQKIVRNDSRDFFKEQNEGWFETKKYSDETLENIKGKLKDGQAIIKAQDGEIKVVDKDSQAYLKYMEDGWVNISDKSSGALKVTSDKINEIKNTKVKDLFNDIKSKINDVNRAKATIAVEGNTNPLKSALEWFKNNNKTITFDTVLDIKQNVLNTLKNKISSVLNFSFGGKADGGVYANGSWKPITQYASGGLPSTGQMFIAREAGPELVGKIGNNTAVMNNNQIVSSVASGVAQAVASVMGNGSDTVELYVHTDEGTVIDRINRRKRQTGVCPIEI